MTEADRGGLNYVSKHQATPPPPPPIQKKKKALSY